MRLLPDAFLCSFLLSLLPAHRPGGFVVRRELQQHQNRGHVHLHVVVQPTKHPRVRRVITHGAVAAVAPSLSVLFVSSRPVFIPSAYIFRAVVCCCGNRRLRVLVCTRPRHVCVFPLQCNVGQWSATPVVCEPSCLSLTVPTNADSCVKQLMSEPFTTGVSSLARWQVSPQVPATMTSAFWALQNNSLVTTAGQQCAYTSAYNYSSLCVSAPKWLDTMEPSQLLSLTVSLYLSSGVLGVHFLYTDPSTHYFFLLDAGLGVVKYGAVIAGVQQLMGQANWASPTQFVNVTTVVTLLSSNGVHAVTLNTSTGNVTYTWADARLTKGSFGFLSNGVGAFDDLVANTTCDGFGQVCADFTSGMTCEFQCAAGYTLQSGNTDRTCTYGVWSGAPLLCKIGGFLVLVCVSRPAMEQLFFEATFCVVLARFLPQSHLS